MHNRFYPLPTYPVTWNDLISLCENMEKAGYTNPLGITLCDASIESLQFTWLLRVYGFKSNELLSEENPNLNINFDPKTNWALNNIYLFPIEINKAPYEMLIRVPGIGIKGARKIVSSRRINSLDFLDLKKLVK